MAISAEVLFSPSSPIGVLILAVALVLALILILILVFILALILILVFIYVQGLIFSTSLLVLGVFKKSRYDFINGSINVKINGFKVWYSLLLNLKLEKVFVDLCYIVI